MRVAIVTGGTRGIGRGITKVLIETGEYGGLILTYNTNKDAAEAYRSEIEGSNSNVKLCIVGGDLSVSDSRDAIFKCFDEEFGDADLCTVVHNAGQYVGVTSDNAHGITSTDATKKFGDGSLLKEDGAVDFEFMHFYQKLYGEAFVDICERSLKRMKDAHSRCQEAGEKYRGSIVGISSPGVNSAFKMVPGYDMPGSGKCLMEFSIRHYAHSAAKYGINCNVIIPGVTRSDAWETIAEKRGLTQDQLHGNFMGMIPMKEVADGEDIGDVVAFLSGSAGGRFMTGLCLRVDGGLHLGG
mmetsp:Transcript_3024/g.6567  ORF Transcript_3024/g.6567 Transcript_3024/m.6567 type:complete len:297 (+) Transcript_3024:76-966(+)